MRRDRRGRRIGRNAWRELVTDAWFWADQAWWHAAELEALGYATELEEYREQHPRPNLGDFMRELAPAWSAGRGHEYALEAAS